MKYKKCPRCKQSKLSNCYWKNKSSSDGLDSYCKNCKNNIRRYKRANNIGSYGRLHFRELIKRGVVITEDEYNKLSSLKENGCMICSIKDNLEIDHDHKSGIVRGILCGNCNKAIGLMKESIPSFERAIFYLSSN